MFKCFAIKILNFRRDLLALSSCESNNSELLGNASLCLFFFFGGSSIASAIVIWISRYLSGGSLTYGSEVGLQKIGDITIPVRTKEPFLDVSQYSASKRFSKPVRMGYWESITGLSAHFLKFKFSWIH